MGCLIAQRWQGLAKSVEHRTLVRKFTDPVPHAWVRVQQKPEFIVCVKIIGPCSLTWGTELQVPLKFGEGSPQWRERLPDS
jgi:hypothetical protein